MRPASPPADRAHSIEAAVAGATRAESRDGALYVPQLDGLRALAFALVFVHHVPGATGLLYEVGRVGWVGVHLFLALSAFLLTRILLRELETRGRIDVRAFFIRRILRIWPLYFGFVLAVSAWRAARHNLPDDFARRLLVLFTFTDNLWSGLHRFNTIAYLNHLWTVSLEEQFYLVLPLLVGATCARRASLPLCLAAAWVTFVLLRWWAVAAGMQHPFIWTAPFSADAVLIGAALATTPVQRVMARLPPAATCLAGASLLASLTRLPHVTDVGWHSVYLYVVTGLGAGLLCHAALTWPWLRFLGLRPFRYLGKISYGLYVFHMGALSAGGLLAERLGGGWQLAAGSALGITLALAVCSYELWERPFLKLKARYEIVRTRPA